jgi:hypothetical protein
LRMVTKITYSYAVGQLGLDAFESDLPKIIIDYAIQIASHLMGGSDTDLPVRRDFGMGLVPWGIGQFSASAYAAIRIPQQFSI